ncbi:MAG: hypothetical protein Q7U51_07105 [Methanoregula sp.]|nr:hypothetical protein [Methanoregula sp.]
MDWTSSYTFTSNAPSGQYKVGRINVQDAAQNYLSKDFTPEVVINVQNSGQSTLTSTATQTASPTTIPFTTPYPTQTASTQIATIYIRNNVFVPQELTVPPGTGITWINNDATTHAIKTTGTHAGTFNSGDLVKGSQFGFNFGQEGTFEIIDTYSNSIGVIIVKKGALLIGNPTVQTSAITTVPTSLPTSLQTTGPTSSPTAVSTTVQTTTITTAPPTGQTTILTIATTPNYDAKIAALESQLAVQNQKIEEQGNILDKITSFLRNIFGWK